MSLASTCTWAMRRAVLAPILAIVLLASGCASITGSELQNISVQTADQTGALVSGADCKLTNDKGTWTTKAPGFVMVMRSGEDLAVHCTAEDREPAMARAVSRANGGMVGNILFGGVVGAVIDNERGTGYDYPEALRVVFGTTLVIDKKDDVPGAAPMPQVSAPQQPSTSPAASSPSQGTTLDDLKDLLPRR